MTAVTPEVNVTTAATWSWWLFESETHNPRRVKLPLYIPNLLFDHNVYRTRSSEQTLLMQLFHHMHQMSGMKLKPS